MQVAGEAIGKACEAVVSLALRLGGVSKSRVFWNARPAGMSITTDFAIGESADIPDAVILVTHSVSPMQSHKKFWRNIGELVELKTALSVVPRVINVVFGDARMEKLTSVTIACMDNAIDVLSLPNGAVLLAELRALAGSLKGKSREDTVESVEGALSSTASKVVLDLARQLKRTLSLRGDTHESLWSYVRSGRAAMAKTCEPTTVKRGVSKFLIFEKEDRRALFTAAKSRRSLTVAPPPLATELGFMGGLGNQRVTDQDMLSFARDWNWADLEFVAADSPMDEINQIAVTPLRAVANLTTYTNYIRQHRSKLVLSSGMEEALRACHADPCSLTSLPIRVDTVWLLDYLFSLFKAHLGGHNEYGQSQLAEDIGDRSGISASGYRVFADWLNRRPKGVLSDELLRQISVALARRLSKIQDTEIAGTLESVREYYIRTFLNIKLLTYENLNPLESIVKRELRRLGIAYREQSRVASIWGELAGESAATSSVVITENGTAFYSSSVTDAGRDHKRKELEGRGTGLRWAIVNGKVVPRSGISRLVLVIDGTWDATDVTFLGNAGWHEVVYLHEIPALVDAGC